LGYFCHFQKAAQSKQPPSRRKFAQSGHLAPVQHTNKAHYVILYKTALLSFPRTLYNVPLARYEPGLLVPEADAVENCAVAMLTQIPMSKSNIHICTFLFFKNIVQSDQIGRISPCMQVLDYKIRW
jgi:hypothetical protein